MLKASILSCMGPIYKTLKIGFWNIINILIFEYAIKHKHKNIENMRTPDLNQLIALVEQEEQKLRKELATKSLRYRGRYVNLIGYKNFHLEHDNVKLASSLEFDLSIVEKAIGKRNLKSLNA